MKANKLDERIIEEKAEVLFFYETNYNIPNGDPFTGEQRFDEETKKILVSDVRIKRYIRDFLASTGEIIYISSKENNKSDSTTNRNASGSARRVEELKERFSNEDIKKTILDLDKNKILKNLDLKEEVLEKIVTLFNQNITEEVITECQKSGKEIKFEIKTELEGILKDSKQSKLIGSVEKSLQDSIKQIVLYAESSANLLLKCIDVRLFGGISTKEGDNIKYTGPVQFSLLNSSLNKINLRIHQNTSVLESKQSNSQGAIATTTIVPYSIMQIHGWINPKVAEITGMNYKDLALFYKGLWLGTSGEGSSHSRSKTGQNSILIIEILYNKPEDKLYDTDRLVSINPNNDKKEEQIRNRADYEFNVSKLTDLNKSDKVKEIRYYTEIESLRQEFEKFNKFNKMIL